MDPKITSAHFCEGEIYAFILEAKAWRDASHLAQTYGKYGGCARFKRQLRLNMREQSKRAVRLVREFELAGARE